MHYYSCRAQQPSMQIEKEMLMCNLKQGIINHTEKETFAKKPKRA